VRGKAFLFSLAGKRICWGGGVGGCAGWLCGKILWWVLWGGQGRLGAEVWKGTGGGRRGVRVRWSAAVGVVRAVGSRYTKSCDWVSFCVVNIYKSYGGGVAV